MSWSLKKIIKQVEPEFKERAVEFSKIKTFEDYMKIMNCLSLTIMLTDEQAEQLKEFLKESLLP